MSADAFVNKTWEEKPSLASGRDNPLGFTENPLVNVSSPKTGSALVWDRNQSWSVFHWLHSASYLAGFELIRLKTPRISVKTRGGGRGVCQNTDWVQIRMESASKLWKSLVPMKIRAYVKDYCKRNGLLTLSVIAVVTGCMLGFLLRTFNLSTQVSPNQPNSGMLSQCCKSNPNMSGEHSQPVVGTETWAKARYATEKVATNRSSGLTKAPFFVLIASLCVYLWFITINQPFEQKVNDKIKNSGILCSSVCCPVIKITIIVNLGGVILFFNWHYQLVDLELNSHTG